MSNLSFQLPDSKKFQQIITSCPNDFTRLSEREVNLVVWRREPLPDLVRSELTQIVTSDAFVSQALKKTNRDLFECSFAKLPTQESVEQSLRSITPQLSVLAPDITQIIGLYAVTLTRCNFAKACKIQLRLEVMPRSEAGFHVDFGSTGFSKVRTLVTYLGSGTEWTPNSNFSQQHGFFRDKHRLAQNQEQIFAANPCDVLMFKGGEDGCYHRSPAQTNSPAERRILLVIDPR